MQAAMTTKIKRADEGPSRARDSCNYSRRQTGERVKVKIRPQLAVEGQVLPRLRDLVRARLADRWKFWGCTHPSQLNQLPDASICSHPLVL